MKKALALLLALLGCGMVLSAEAPYVMNVLYPGEPSARMSTFLDNEFKAAIEKDLNITPKIAFAPWSNYFNKIDMMLAANESVDWFWHGTFATGLYVARKQVQPLNDLLAKYGPDILRMIPKDNFRPNTINGKIYSIPSQASSTAEKFYTILARTDILDQVGVKTISSFQELLDACAKVKAKFPDMTCFASVPWQALLREAAPGWYTTDFGITIVNENEAAPKAYAFLEQKDIIKKLNALAKTLVDKGYVSEEMLSDPNNDVGRFQSGNCVFWAGAVSRPLEQAAAVQKNVPSAMLREFSLNPKAARYIFMSSNEAIFIPVSNKNPEKAIQFLNWIYKSQENYDLTLFGVKGKDFSVDSGNHIARSNMDDLFYEWMFRNNKYLRMPTNVNPDFVKDFQDWDKGAKYSKLYGFNFDATPVKAEAAKINALANQWNPLVWGLVDASKGSNYDTVLKALKNAGIDKYMAEFNKQLAAYRAASK